MRLMQSIFVKNLFFARAVFVVATILFVAMYWQITTLQRDYPLPSVDVLESGGLILGKPNSPMELVVVFSPTCPHCQAFFRDQLEGLQDKIKLRLYFKGEPHWATSLVCAYQNGHLEESLLIIGEYGVQSLPRCLPDENINMKVEQWMSESNRVNKVPVPTFYWVEQGKFTHRTIGYSPEQWRNIWAKLHEQSPRVP